MKQSSLAGLFVVLAACSAPIDPVPDTSFAAAPAQPGAEAPVVSDARDEAPLMSADVVWSKRPPIESIRWREGERVELARASSRCEARRWGEWIRLECHTWSSAVEQLAGPIAGVQMSGKESSPTRMILFPTGDRAKRVFQLGSVFGGWRMSWTTAVDAIVSVDWEDGARNPILSID